MTVDEILRHLRHVPNRCDFAPYEAALLGVAEHCAASMISMPPNFSPKRQVFADGLVDESIIGLGDIDPDVPREPGGFPRPSNEQLLQWFSARNAPINAIEECSGWLCFGDKDEIDAPWDGDEDFDDENVDDERRGDVIDLPRQPYIAPPKVGRNEPCPCDSGKKYKKCCGK